MIENLLMVEGSREYKYNIKKQAKEIVNQVEDEKSRINLPFQLRKTAKQMVQQWNVGLQVETQKRNISVKKHKFVKKKSLSF